MPKCPQRSTPAVPACALPQPPRLPLPTGLPLGCLLPPIPPPHSSLLHCLRQPCRTLSPPPTPPPPFPCKPKARSALSACIDGSSGVTHIAFTSKNGIHAVLGLLSGLPEAGGEAAAGRRMARSGSGGGGGAPRWCEGVGEGGGLLKHACAHARPPAPDRQHTAQTAPCPPPPRADRLATPLAPPPRPPAGLQVAWMARSRGCAAAACGCAHWGPTERC